jgi:hypothetical protein
MRAVWTAIAVAGGLGLGVLAAGSASAATTIYNFTGDCSDCVGTSTGTLTLANAPSGAISKSDFVNFIYKSSLVSFQINSSDIIAVMGSIDPNNLGKAYIDIIQLGGTGWEFERNADGSWSVYSDITGGQSHSSSIVGGGASLGAGGGGGGGGSSDNGSGDNGSGGNTPGAVSTFSFSSDGEDFVVQRTNDDTGPTSSVPEPASWAMMLVGFGGMGALLRNRRRSLRGIEIA